jgi:uncharacterized protein (DUF885 family)
MTTGAGRRWVGVIALVSVAACSAPPPAPAKADANAAFQALADRFVDETLKRDPATATYLGVHDYDDRLADMSRAGIEADVAALREAKRQFEAVDPAALSEANQIDRLAALSAIDSELLTDTVIRPWATNPDLYSTAVTGAAFTMIKRNYAPADVRLKSLVARERAMVATLDVARQNLDNPPAIYTDIAIEQIDGNIDFFKDAVAGAFGGVKDEALIGEFRKTNQAVIDALGAYKTFLVKDLKPRSHGNFAIGAEALAAKFKADEMVDVPLDQLVAIARADLKKNQDAFVRAAAAAVPGMPARDALTKISRTHPKASELLSAVQGELDGLRQFIADHKLVTIPSANPATVEETPPFMRATTIASMDSPGPFEKTSTEAYYNVTLPDPSWPKAKIESYMRAWYPAMSSNVSVHEVYPGHYTQFLFGPRFPSRIRKVFGTTTNIEGWAHYCEQMMLDEGLANGDPTFRLAQLQDALLRDVRFIVGIELHTGRITVEQAQKMFEQDAYQEPPVALAEAKRGTSDPTYGYYTLGKLMILKLRDDYKAKMGDRFSLQEFHDRFLGLGPVGLPLIRRAMLGQVGDVLPSSAP